MTKKYKIQLEAEIEVDDYSDDINFTLFNSRNPIEFIEEEDEDWNAEYYLTLDLFEGCTGETLGTADIKTIKVEEITNDN